MAEAINRMNPADGKSRAVVRDDLIDWMRENGVGQIVPVAHNLEFDLRFLKRRFRNSARSSPVTAGIACFWLLPSTILSIERLER